MSVYVLTMIVDPSQPCQYTRVDGQLAAVAVLLVRLSQKSDDLALCADVAARLAAVAAAVWRGEAGGRNRAVARARPVRQRRGVRGR